MKPDLARKNLRAEDSAVVVTVTEVAAVVAGSGQSYRLFLRTRLARNMGSSTCGLAEKLAKSAGDPDEYPRMWCQDFYIRRLFWRTS